MLKHGASRRHQEWLGLLKKINRETPKHLQLHLIVDNYATHNHPKVKAWLEKHKRFHMHFTPTSSSWMKMVGMRPAKSSTQPRIAKAWCALKFEWAPVLAF